MKLKVLQLFSVTIVLTCHSPGSAQQILFYDNFDGPLAPEWFQFGQDVQQGDRVLRDGHYVVTPTAANTMNSFVAKMPDNVSIRTRVRVLEEVSNDWIFVGVGGRDTINHPEPDTGNYYGGITTDGRIGIGISAGPVLSQTSTDLDILETSVDLQLDLIDDEISLTVWEAGTEMPESPQVLVIDQTIASGENIFTFYNPRGSNRPPVAYDFVEVVALPYLAGDLDGDQQLTSADIDKFSNHIRDGVDAPRLDFNTDNQVDMSDRSILITDLIGTWIGDANVDGEFNSADFVQVFQAGQYEDNIAGNSTWATGDWDGDGDFTSGDFVVAFQDDGYEQGPRPMTMVVPESSSGVLLLTSLLSLALFRRNVSKVQLLMNAFT